MPSEDSFDDRKTTHFGYTAVALDEKQGLVNNVFQKVARRYDIMNDLMSGGLHRAWKDVLVSKVKPSRTRAFRHLDVAGGTGDVAFRVARRGGPQTHVTVLDINPDMLAVGEERVHKLRRNTASLEFITGNAEDLPLENDSYDCYTIAFGIRNVPRIDRALSEAYRVLRRGGRFLCLEFSDVDVPGLDKLYDSFSFKLIPQIGRIVAGDAEPYRYLVESIRKFPTADYFADLIGDAGFRNVSFTRLSGGIVAIHSAWKL